MVLVVAFPELAEKAGEVVEGEKAYVVKVRDGTQLRHKVYSYQPDLILLDATFLGSSTKTIEQIPLLMARTRSRPDIIALVPWLDAGVKKQLSVLGCYGAVKVNGRAFSKELRLLIAATLVSRPSRLSRPPVDGEDVIH